MENKLRVHWTTEAQRTFSYNLDYLSENWEAITINKFLDRVDEAIALIASNPQLFPKHDDLPDVHRCVVNSHISLFYIVFDDRIDLITFWNTHQDPENLKLD